MMKSGRFVELCAFLAFLPYILSHESKWLEAYADSIADVRTRQFVWADSTLLDLFFLVKTLPFAVFPCILIRVGFAYVTQTEDNGTFVI